MAKSSIEIEISNVPVLVAPLLFDGWTMQTEDMAIIDGVVVIIVSAIAKGEMPERRAYLTKSFNNILQDKYRTLVRLGELQPIESLPQEDKLKLWQSLPEEYRTLEKARVKYLLNALL